MLQRVDVGERSLAAYRGVAPDELLDELVELAAPLRGARVLQVNATPYGGGVSELLRSTVPLLVDLDIAAEWRVISGDERFFRATKALHNGLQGMPDQLTPANRAAYLDSAQQHARELQRDYDVIVVHDPQPAPLPALAGRGNARWVWRCHIDTSAPDRSVWEFLRPYLTAYDAAVFTLRAFVPPDLPAVPVRIIPPAIDPLSPKNLPLGLELGRGVLDWLGLHPGHPLVTQVSRFDPWKDPLGVIAAYRLAREEVPNLQLVLAGSMALDDPEGWEVYRCIEQEARDDELVHVLTNLTGVGNVEVNALQRMSDVIVQKSLREGFGLVVSEALWKGTPVVAGDVGGIPLQMADGVGGVLVVDVPSCAEALVRLLRDGDEARRLGEAGRARVRRQFLLPRLLVDELSLFNDLAAAKPLPNRAAGPAPAIARDPVCGMAVPIPGTAPSVTVDGRRVVFCSEGCRRVFVSELPNAPDAGHPAGHPTTHGASAPIGEPLP
jgi:trehalose synthase